MQCTVFLKLHHKYFFAQRIPSVPLLMTSLLTTKTRSRRRKHPKTKKSRLVKYDRVCCRYSTVAWCSHLHSWQPIASPWWRGRGNILLVQCMVFILPELLYHFIHYCLIFDRLIRAPDCFYWKNENHRNCTLVEIIQNQEDLFHFLSFVCHFHANNCCFSW